MRFVDSYSFTWKPKRMGLPVEIMFRHSMVKTRIGPVPSTWVLTEVAGSVVVLSSVSHQGAITVCGKVVPLWGIPGLLRSARSEPNDRYPASETPIEV